jgi:hypothetical protein
MVHVSEVRPRKDKRGFDLISDVPPFGKLWYGDANAIVSWGLLRDAYSVTW